MKKIIQNLAIAAALIAGTINTSCQSQAERKEAAHEKVQDEKKDLREAREKERVETEKAATAEEWKTFRAENEIKIRDLENRIDELKIKLKKPGKALDAHYEKRINELDVKVRDLRAKIDNYEKENTHSNWESFKREFNHDMDEIGKALKDLTVDNER